MWRGKKSSSLSVSAFDAHFINSVIRILLRFSGSGLNRGWDKKKKKGEVVYFRK